MHHQCRLSIGDGVSHFREDMASEKNVSHGLQETSGPHTDTLLPSLHLIKPPQHMAVISQQIKPLDQF